MSDNLNNHQDEAKKVENDEEKIKPLDEEDIKIMKAYKASSPYDQAIKKLEEDIETLLIRINELKDVDDDVDTGLAPSALWNLEWDQYVLENESPLLVAHCIKIINADSDHPKYMIKFNHSGTFLVELADTVAPGDIEEGMCVGVEYFTYKIRMVLPPKIDRTITMMQVEDKPDVTYNDIGGCNDQIKKLREVLEIPFLHPERFAELGIDPPKGVLLYGPPGTGKTLCARAVANRTDACFIRVIVSELLQKYAGEGARMIRELFQFARFKKACIIFFDEIDAIGGARRLESGNDDNEIQRTMLELLTQLDGFTSRGHIKVLMATNRPDTLDEALMRPGRVDRKIEFGLPDIGGRIDIFKICTRTMSIERDIHFEQLARLCPNTTGADIRAVCTEAGMNAIRERRKVATKMDFVYAINKTITSNRKFNATSQYMAYN